MDKSKVELIASLPYPTTVWEVCAIFGHAGFYKRFIQEFSKLALPLSKLLQNDIPFKFEDSCKEAFDKLKKKLISAPIIQPPNWKLPFELMYDASNYGIRAVLGQ